jgi:TM2 domain-containing membrane protein YozV
MIDPGEYMAEEHTRDFCEICGEEIDKHGGTCPKCGVDVKFPKVKNPVVSAILSFVIPGLGQIYNGQIVKGVGFVFIAVFLLFAILLLVGYVSYPIFWIYAIYPIFWIYAIYDAYISAKKIGAGAIKPK